MKMKLLGAAVTAALLGLSTASFAEGSAASGQDTPREAGAAKAGPGSSETTTDSASNSATTGSTVTTNCDTLNGAAKTRCLREQGASSGSSTTAPTSQPGASGPGTSDKTDPKNPSAPGVGTSSAGSSK